MTKTDKPTVWILDDQWSSALTKISWFFNLTTATFESPRNPEALDALKVSLEKPGWALVPLDPEDISRIKLRNGIVLIDVDWSHAPSGTKGMDDLSAQERDSYGLTIASQIISTRTPEDNLDIILFSHTRGDELAAYYFELSQQGVRQLHPVVIVEKDSKGPRIRSYGWNALERITGHLLGRLPPETRNGIARAIDAQLEQQLEKAPGSPESESGWQRSLSLQDFTPNASGLTIEGIALTDLAVPFFRKTLAAGLDAELESASAAKIEQLKRWQSLLVGERIAFELSSELKNVPTALLRALLRYRKIDHFDGFLHLQDIKSSRYADPVGALRKNIEEGGSKLENAPLHKGFKHQIQVNLGTPIRKLRENQPLGKTFSPFQKLPDVLKEPGILSTKSSKTKPQAEKKEQPRGKLHIESEGTKTWFRLEVDKETIWDNPELQTSSRLSNYRSASGEPVELLKILQLDPDNIEVCHEIAQNGSTLLKRIPAHDERWGTFLKSASATILRLRKAETNLRSYVNYIKEIHSSINSDDISAFTRDIEGWETRHETWIAQREVIQNFLKNFQMQENRGTTLAQILERTNTNDGLDELEAFLKQALPRARKYASTTIENTLERTGLLTTGRLALARRGFAKLFPSSDKEACRMNWLRICIAALGPRCETITTWPDDDFEDRIVPLLAKEILQEIAALEGYDFLERLEVIPDDDTQLKDEENGIYSIKAHNDPE